MSHYLTYNGESSADYGLLVGAQKSYDVPKRDVTKYTIAGRNGDLIKDNGRFENAQIEYVLLCKNKFESVGDAISAWLKVPTTYCTLKDSHHPDYYRMALVTDAISYETGMLNRSAKASVVFECKPEKYLVSGATAKKYTTATAITNPTRFSSKPLLRVYGTGAGEVKVGAYTVKISAIASSYVDIDCDLMDCFKGSENLNSTVTLPNGFPEFVAGANKLSFSGDITAVEITGRWWTI